MPDLAVVHDFGRYTLRLLREGRRLTCLLACVAGVTAGMIALSNVSAVAQTFTRNAERERRFELQLEAIAPNAVPQFKAATAAMDRHDVIEAARLFRQVVQQVPTFSPALRRLGGSLIDIGQREEGLKYVEQAVQLERTPENLISLAEALVQPVNGQQPSVPVTQRAFSLAQEARVQARGYDDPSYPALTAGLALRLRQAKEFRESTNDLAARFPNQMVTHYFSAILAAMDGEWIEADTQIKEAQKRGLPAAEVAAFLNSGVGRQALIRRMIRYTTFALVLWVAGLLLLFLIGKVLSQRTLRSIEGTDINEIAAPGELLLRRVYRMLIVVAGSYYYVSLPFVLISVIAGTGLIIYGFMVIGWLPVGLILTLAAGALWTVIKCIQTLFVRVPFDPPGRSLEVAEAPGLWTLTQRVAEAVGTRPVDEVRITPGIEMAVYEHGSRRERRRDGARRVLILGVGLIDGFRQAPFCAVLAHEYGHFAHRDTAGGDLALRVNNHMERLAVAMIQNRQAVVWNLAWQFLRIYSRLFRRITHGAMRLQEVLADRVAACLYGAPSFEEGLHHVVRRFVEFNVTVTAEVKEALETKRELRNVYGLHAPQSAALERAIDEALYRESSEDDTHPGPAERFRLVRGVSGTLETVADGMLWDLFANGEGVALEMTERIRARLRAPDDSEPLAAAT
jgi:tetratricopeptide (TPR) repeat protein